jgi:ankyrin repeat protein
VLFACFDTCPEEAELLACQILGEGVNPNHFDLEGKTPIHVAVKKKQLKALEFGILSRKFDLNASGRLEITPLAYSIRKGQSDAFIALLRDHRVDVFKRNMFGNTPRQMTLINSAYYRILILAERA